MKKEKKERNLRSDLEQAGWMKVREVGGFDVYGKWINYPESHGFFGPTTWKKKLRELYLMKEDPQDAKLDKATFKKAMKVFADEFNNCFTLSQIKTGNSLYYDNNNIHSLLGKQLKSDWDNFVDFIDSRLDDELLDKMVKDGTLKE